MPGGLCPKGHMSVGAIIPAGQCPGADVGRGGANVQLHVQPYAPVYRAVTITLLSRVRFNGNECVSSDEGRHEL